ncbi:hypothetical protein DM01DRAFT_1128783 [Hesseltinella vesiculosa]|uniref:F-box domain-containing protein n=1 Tax=Hesseltinella vesiculosa TaxID=101127 RepID=A0A1X2GUP0_9FUNG|nr:hypothetical protein DM01DRAFT_1128783 [Hesseltinella vesiculosa]
MVIIMDCLSRLPTEILEQITSTLQPDDILTMCCVCRDWHSRCLPELYRNVSIDFIGTECTAGILAKHNPSTLKPQGYSTRSLSMSSERTINCKELETIAMACPFITSLHFVDEVFYRTMLDISALRNCGILRSQKYSIGHNGNAKGLPNYSKVILGLQFPPPYNQPLMYCKTAPSVTLAFCELMFQHHPHLKALSMALHLRPLKPELPPLLRILPAGLTDLTLDLGDCRLYTSFVDLIHDSCPQLTSLSLSIENDGILDPFVCSESDVEPINRSLKSFTLKCRELLCLGLWSWVYFLGKRYGQQLSTVHIYNNSRLEHPKTQTESMILDTFIPTFVEQHGATLRSLKMKNLDFSQAFWQSMKLRNHGIDVKLWDVTCLDTKTLYNRSYKEMHFLLDFLKPSIRQLRLSMAKMEGCFDGYAALFGQCPSLEHLHLERADDREVTPLFMLLQHCTRLRHLTLDHCTVGVVESQLSSIHGLRSLTFNRARFTCAEMNQALKYLPRLATFHIGVMSSTILHERSSDPPNAPPAVALTFPNPDMSIHISSIFMINLLDKSYITGTSTMVSARTAHSCDSWIFSRGEVAQVTEEYLQAGLMRQHILAYCLEFICDDLRYLKFKGRVLIKRGSVIPRYPKNTALDTAL